jgi:BlaI family penicillinase repressor
MTRQSRISEAEWRVMEVVWDKESITSSEVIEALAPGTGWHAKTVRTLLARLVEKGYLDYEDEGGRYRYSATVTRTKCVRRETESFVDRVFGGRPVALLSHFVEGGELSGRELAELKELLDEEEGEA